MPDPNPDIAIVGAGAAGLMAAIAAGRTRPADVRVAALDSAQKLGAKILVSGGGRCNVTHDSVLPADFAGGNRNQIAKILRSFDVPATIAFFRDLGVHLKTEGTGKLFPTTNKAQTVLDALLTAATQAGATLLTDHRVISVQQTADGFRLETSKGPIITRKLILATGGKSLPKTGSDGAGYTLAQSLGHSITTTTPALVPLVLEPNHFLTSLTGVSLDAELAIRSSTGKIIHRQAGSMLFTHFGVSGPAVLDISRHWIAHHAADPQITLTANLLPTDAEDSLDRFIAQSASRHPRAAVASLFRKRLPQRLAEEIIRHAAKIDPASPLSQLPKLARRALARAFTALPLPVVRDRGYLFAEVTAGGVPLDEIDASTMASRLCPGLYLCGEILDADGRVGGYNFQWAWCTGRLAGTHAAKSIIQKSQPADAGHQAPDSGH